MIRNTTIRIASIVLLAIAFLSAALASPIARANDDNPPQPTLQQLKDAQPKKGKTFDHRPTTTDLGFPKEIAETVVPTTTVGLASVQQVSDPFLFIGQPDQFGFFEGNYRLSGLDAKTLPIQVYVQASSDSDPEFWCALMQYPTVISFTSWDEYKFDDMQGKVFSFNGQALDAHQPVMVVCSFQATIESTATRWQLQFDVYADYKYVSSTDYLWKATPRQIYMPIAAR
jgi:hypothetical protein